MIYYTNDEFPFRNLYLSHPNVIQGGKLHPNFDETIISDYMKNYKIDINIYISSGSKNFTAYTMDFTKKYIEINADYRS